MLNSFSRRRKKSTEIACDALQVVSHSHCGMSLNWAGGEDVFISDEVTNKANTGSREAWHL